MKRILVINQGHTNNYGDIAINDTIITFFKNKGIDVEFMPYWEETKVFGKHYRKLPYRLIKNIMKSFFIVDWLNKRCIKKQLKNKKYNAVIIGGGELLGNHIGFNSSLYVLTKIFNKKDVPVYLLGVSGDIDVSKKMISRYKKSLKRCKEIIVRDNHTKKICNQTYEVSCTKGVDVVFSYLKVTKKNNYDMTKKNIVVLVPISYNYKIKEELNLNNKNEYYDYLKKIVIKNLKGNDRLVVTSTVLDDEKTSKELYQYLLKTIQKNEIQYLPYSSLNNFIDLLKKSNLVISARMHAMILGLIFENKIEAIPFKRKLQVFKEEYQSCKDLDKVQENAYVELEKICQEIL